MLTISATRGVRGRLSNVGTGSSWRMVAASRMARRSHRIDASARSWVTKTVAIRRVRRSSASSRTRRRRVGENSREPISLPRCRRSSGDPRQKLPADQQFHATNAAAQKFGPVSNRVSLCISPLCSRIDQRLSCDRGHADSPSDACRPSSAQYSLFRGDCAWTEHSVGDLQVNRRNAIRNGRWNGC